MNALPRRFWIAFGSRHWPAIYIHTPWWHIVIGRWKDALFSERNGLVWSRKIGQLRLTIRTSQDHPNG